MRGFFLQKKFHVLKSCSGRTLSINKNKLEIKIQLYLYFILHRNKNKQEKKKAQLQPLSYLRFKSNQQLNEYNTSFAFSVTYLFDFVSEINQPDVSYVLCCFLT